MATSSDCRWKQNRKIEVNVALIIACMPCFPSFFMKFKKLAHRACSTLDPLKLCIRRPSHHLPNQFDESPESSIDKKELSTTCTSASSNKGKKRSLDRYMGFLYRSTRTQDSQDLHTDIDVEFQQQQLVQEQDPCHRFGSLEKEPQSQNQPEIMRTIEYSVERATASRKP